jgi:hypothetical protein
VDWSNISGIIMALLVAIGLPLALKKGKKAGSPEKRRGLPPPSADRRGCFPGGKR